MWSPWKCVMMMVSTLAGSMPAAFHTSFLVIRPAVGASWAPVPESNSTSLPLVRMAVTVNVIGTCASVSPPAFSAAFTSSSEAFLTKPGSCAFSQTPSYIWMTSTSPTLNLTKPLSAFCANAGVRNSSGPSRPKAAAAAVAEITKPRREMLCMMSSLDTRLACQTTGTYASIKSWYAIRKRGHGVLMPRVSSPNGAVHRTGSTGSLLLPGADRLAAKSVAEVQGNVEGMLAALLDRHGR